MPDEELSLHEVGPEEAGPSFIAIDGVTTVEPQLTFTRHTGWYSIVFDAPCLSIWSLHQRRLRDVPCHG